MDNLRTIEYSGTVFSTAFVDAYKRNIEPMRTALRRLNQKDKEADSYATSADVLQVICTMNNNAFGQLATDAFNAASAAFRNYKTTPVYGDNKKKGMFHHELLPLLMRQDETSTTTEEEEQQLYLTQDTYLQDPRTGDNQEELQAIKLQELNKKKKNYPKKHLPSPRKQKRTLKKRKKQQHLQVCSDIKSNTS
ncbi:hypothetical protein OS493_030378 [Desmophyllum pertusum]|uniref:Uncharacterized protein n=1 Tax=Desmophyllum pertusum TaxID=174260 RepID=A0A9W9Z9Z4_9CNID|nr:hypothetical protein OS493_030378 [Desmophyllum pertusum]